MTGLERVFTLLPDAVIVADRAGMIRAASNAVREVLGWEPDELIGKPVITIVPPSLREQHLRSFAALLDTGVGRLLGKVLPVAALHRDGHEVDVELVLSAAAEDDDALIVASIRAPAAHPIDAPQVLDRDRLTLALDAADMGVWRWDVRSGEVVWDERTAILFGFEPDQTTVTYEDYQARLHPDERARLAAQIDAAVEARDAFEIVHRIVRISGETRWMHGYGRPLFDDAGELVGMIGVTTDITERKASLDAAAWLAAIVESANDAVIGKNLDGIVTSWNKSAERLYGWRAEEIIGLSITTIAPSAYHAEIEKILEDIRNGRRLEAIETVRRHRSGRLLDVSITVSPVYDASQTIIGASVAAHDISDRKMRERRDDLRAVHERMLAQLTARLADALTPDDVLDAIVVEGIDTVGGDAGLVALLDDHGRQARVARATGYPVTLATVGTEFSLDASLPICVPFRTKRPLLVGRDEVATEHADAALLLQEDTKAVMAIPMVVEGRVTGVIGISYRDPPPEAVEDEDWLTDIGGRCAHALQRAQLFELERAARTRAEQASEQLAFLSEASIALSRSLEVDEVAETVADLAVPRLADWCQVTLTIGSPAEPVIAVKHRTAERGAAVRELTEAALAKSPSRPFRPLLRGATVRLSSEDVAALRSASGPRHRELIDGLELRSLLVVPLVTRGAVAGGLTLASTRSTSGFDDADVELAEELARRAATAIDNARLFFEQRELARRLQENLLPRELPRVPGLELGARYRAAGEGTEVGGDFYDVFGVADARWALAVGDVCGQGADAAGITALARHTLRAITPLMGSPADALRSLNERLLEHDLDQRFITVALATLERPANHAGTDTAEADDRPPAFTLALSQAGHPDPVLLRADGSVELMSATRGAMLGVFPRPRLRTGTYPLHPGDVLVFYTDGVIERRRGSEQFGTERLTDVLAACTDASADAIAGRVVEAALEFSGSSATTDDMAVLVARVCPE